MVDVDVTAKPLDILRVTLLNARHEVIYSIKKYDQTDKNVDVFLGVVRPNIKALYLLVKPEFDKETTIKNLLEILDSEDAALILKVYYQLDAWLSDKKLTSLVNEEMLR